ncbi:MAG: histidine ammonia-lyase [Deltaproteobacteria bacterium]|nr:histidine ammonia-lyase [Deltaproteobacteria bacterium]
MNTISINGSNLTPDQVKECLYALPKIQLALDARERMLRSRQVVEESLKSDRPVYGVNTGFGKLATTRIAPDQLSKIQENLVYSHAVGVGEPLPENVSRLAVLLRANVLAGGYSGVRPEIVSLLCECINKGVTPVIPCQGSVGASGDLAPLAHIALMVMGEGEVWHLGTRKKTGDAFAHTGLKGLSLEAKEGLSLINGTQVSLAIAWDVLLQAETLMKLADINAAVSIEGDLASFQPFEEALILLRPHPGALATASNLRKMFAGSELNVSHHDCLRVQDPYSLRCVPQVHGMAKEAFLFAQKILKIELNATTDNPLVFAETGKILSGGNFHGEPIALAMDTLSLALAELGSISERRVAVLIDPIFLIQDAGLNSGFMIPQVVMSALVSENKTLAHPAIVDSIPTSGGQEDHVSMSTWAARKAKQIANNVGKILSIELLAACQAIDLNGQGKKPGKGVHALHQYVRERIPMLKEDRHLSAQLEVAYQLIETGIPVSIVEKSIGVLEI